MLHGTFATAGSIALAILVLCGCGGGGASGSETLTPRGEQCPSGPPGDDQIEAQRTDEQRFKGLEELSKQLLDTGHPLHNATLAGGESTEPVGSHVRTVGAIIANWELEKRQGAELATRREGDGDLRNVAERVRCAADKLIALGPAAKEAELVCWSLELWKTGRAYSRMAAK
jgi:hypothetical protein